jgi:histone arginine demethylase JMJD6
VDAFASHFWMFLFEGRKKWTFFSKEDVNRLRPVYADSMDPVFEADTDSEGLKHASLGFFL